MKCQFVSFIPQIFFFEENEFFYYFKFKLQTKNLIYFNVCKELGHVDVMIKYYNEIYQLYINSQFNSS